tara:strand:+ start:1359 stop:2042 length:684 start_codon:yes stop_codon:yes gene_type:complete
MDALTNKPYLDTLEIEPSGSADASVIWMHGLGADARDFYELPPELGLPGEIKVRYIFPNAPQIPVTINQGMKMRAWYDIAELSARGQDETGIRQSGDRVSELIAREISRGVLSRRIVVAGFSQGGAMALFTGLRYPERLGGVMCLSGYLLLPESLLSETSEANQNLRVFQAHGSEDPMVSRDLGRRGHDALVDAGYRVDWHEYPMAHQVCLEEVRDIGRWLAEVLKR